MSQLLEYFDEDPVIAETKLDEFRVRLIFYFQRRGILPARAEELANDVFVLALSALKKGAVITTNITHFCYGIARNLRLEQFHEHEHVGLPEHAQIADPRPAEILLHRLELEQRLALLSSEDRDLFVMYETEESERPALADSMGTSLIALRVRVHRIRQKLRGRIEAGRRPPP